MALFFIGKPAMAIKKKTIRNYRLWMGVSSYTSLGLVLLAPYCFQIGKIVIGVVVGTVAFYALGISYRFARDIHLKLSDLYASDPLAIHEAATARWRIKVRLEYLIHWPLRPLYNAVFLYVMDLGNYHGYISRAQYNQRLEDCHETGRRYLERSKTFHWALDHCTKAVHTGNAFLAAGMIVLVKWSADVGRPLIVTAALLYVVAVGLVKFASMKRRNLQGY